MVNSLPGFDAWLTHNPLDDQPEPSKENWAEATHRLGPFASDEDLEKLAYKLMEEDIQFSQDCADEHAAESKLDRD